MEGDIAQTVKSFNQAGRDVSQLTQNLNKMLPSNEKQLENILNETEKALKSFQSAMDGINEITGDKELRDGLRDSLKTFPKLLTDTRDTIAIIKETATLANENLTNLQGFTKPLNREGERIVQRLNSSMDNLDALLTQMVLFSKQLNSDEGSLGQLVKNPDLYQNLTRAAENIEQASRKLQPIMDDARDVADKVNRQGILGSGVLKGSGTKGRAGSQYRTTDHW
jgi:phospholipid/cholesterol/gamma-HCH transport system substrate-binding protein